MLYEDFAANLSSYKSKEEMRSAFHKLFEIDGNSLDNLNTLLSQRYPDRFRTGSSTPEEQMEQERRRAVSQTLRNNMLAALEQAYDQAQFQKDDHTAKSKTRARDEDMILALSGSPEEYRHRLTIMNGDDREAKATLALQFIDSMEPLFQKFRKMPLESLTDEQIAENFGDIDLINQVCNQLTNLSKNPHMKFSEQQKERLLGLDAEFGGPMSGVFCRAKAICEPYYERFPSELLQGVDASDIPGLNDENFEINYLQKGVSVELGFFAAHFQLQIEKTALGGNRIQDVTWMDENGRELPLPFASGKPAMPGLDILAGGKPLIALMPDNSAKIFQFSAKNKDYGLKTGGLEMLPDLGPVIDKGVPGDLKGLVNGVKKANHWYVKSSKEYKDLRATLEKVQKEWQALGSDPTEYQQGKLRNQMTELLGDSLLYLEHKEGKKLSGTAMERIAAVEAVRDFAKAKLEKLRLLDMKTQARQAARENAGEQTAIQQGYSPEVQSRNQENMREQAQQAAEFKRADTVVGVKKPKAQMKDLILKCDEYRKIRCLPSEECGDTLEKLRKSLNWSLERLFTAASKSSIPQAEHAFLKQDMARLTVFHLILALRGGDEFTGHAPDMEKALKQNPDGLIGSFANSPVFSQRIGDITPERLNRFIMKEGARSICNEIRNDKKLLQELTSGAVQPSGLQNQGPKITGGQKVM